MDGRVHRKETRIDKQDDKIIKQKKGNGTEFTGVTSCTAVEQKLFFERACEEGQRGHRLKIQGSLSQV